MATQGDMDPPELKHLFYCLKECSKRELLYKLIVNARERLGIRPRVVVYCNNHEAFDTLNEYFDQVNILTSIVCQETWDQYKRYGVVILCTDELMKDVVADFNEMDFVINYDVPEDVEAYDDRCKDLNPAWQGEYATFIKIGEDDEKLRSLCLKKNIPMEIPDFDSSNPLVVNAKKNTAPSRDVDQTKPNENAPPMKPSEPEISKDDVPSSDANDIYEDALNVSTPAGSSTDGAGDVLHKIDATKEDAGTIGKESTIKEDADVIGEKEDSQVIPPTMEPSGHGIPKCEIIRSFEADVTIYEESLEISMTAAAASSVQSENPVDPVEEEAGPSTEAKNPTEEAAGVEEAQKEEAVIKEESPLTEAKNPIKEAAAGEEDDPSTEAKNTTEEADGVEEAQKEEAVIKEDGPSTEAKNSIKEEEADVAGAEEAQNEDANAKNEEEEEDGGSATESEGHIVAAEAGGEEGALKKFLKHNSLEIIVGAMAGAFLAVVFLYLINSMRL